MGIIATYIPELEFLQRWATGKELKAISIPVLGTTKLHGDGTSKTLPTRVFC